MHCALLCEDLECESQCFTTISARNEELFDMIYLARAKCENTCTSNSTNATQCNEECEGQYHKSIEWVITLE